MLSFSVTTIQNFNPNKHDIMQITIHFVMFGMIDVLLYIICTQMWHVPLAQVLPRPQLIFPSKTWFFWNLFDFSVVEITFKSIFPTIWIQILPINFNTFAHQDLSNNTKGTFQFIKKIQIGFNLIFNEKIIQFSRAFMLKVQMSLNQAHAPLLLKSFPKRPKMWFEASQFSGSHKSKQNKQTTFFHKLMIGCFAL